jgi:hypothetical protein
VFLVPVFFVVVRIFKGSERQRRHDPLPEED